MQEFDDVFKTINESVNSKISDRTKFLIERTKRRQEMLEKYGKKSFLDPNPEKPRYPVIDPETGEYLCALIYAAYVRSRQNKEEFIAKKAKKLFDSEGCSEKMNINLSTEESFQSFVDFIDLFEIKDVDTTIFSYID